MDAGEQDVARLGVGEHAVARNIGIRIHEPAREGKHDSEFDRFGGLLRSLHVTGTLPARFRRVAHMTHAIVAHPKGMGAGDQSVVETFADPSPGPKAPVGEMSKGKVPQG